MTRLLRDSPFEFRALRDATAERLGTDARAIEKDYWATEVLRSASAEVGCSSQVSVGPAYTVVFKGGTSLSKAYGLIRRFSEDVDLLVVTDAEGKPLRRILEGIVDHAAHSLGLPFEREHAGRGYLNVRFRTPTVTPAPFLSNGVLLELGSRGGPAPNAPRRVGSMMMDAAGAIDPSALREFTDLKPFEILTLAPERTLAEKLAFLHHRASVGDLAALRRGARHLYDITLVLRDSRVRDALADGAMEHLIRDVDARSAAAGWPFTPRPDTGFATSPAFADTSPTMGATEIRDALTEGLRGIEELVWGDLPSLDECIAEVHRWSQLL